MIAVMVRIEDKLYRLRRNFRSIRQNCSRAAGEVRIHNDQIILHLDDAVVAVPLAQDIAFAKPYAWGDQLYCVGLGIASGDDKAERKQGDKCSDQQQTDSVHIRRFYRTCRAGW